MEQEEPRVVLDRLIAANGDDYLTLSRLVGRNAAYIQQFIKRGSPKRLPERERAVLARYFGVDEKLLGAPVDRAPRANDALRLVPRLAVGASAGPGALADGEALAGRVGFDEKWLRQLGVEPANVSLIRVEGDSMAPTLNDGDDIMVDKGAASRALKDGVHVIRMDEVLMVKRLARGLDGTVSVLSDNPAYPDWADVPLSGLSVIGRVVWVGRKL